MTELPGKPDRWNAINPASEKPKSGRGTAEDETKSDAAAEMQR